MNWLGFVATVLSAALGNGSMTARRARVMRDGHSLMMPANGIVPGDFLVLEAGDVAAADARLRTAHALTTKEAPLTGESTPLEKTTAPTGSDTPLAERHDFVLWAPRSRSGPDSRRSSRPGCGPSLADRAPAVDRGGERHPLQRRLARVRQPLPYICAGIVAVVALAGVLRGWPLLQVFMAAIELDVPGRQSTLEQKVTRRRQLPNPAPPCRLVGGSIAK